VTKVLESELADLQTTAAFLHNDVNYIYKCYTAVYGITPHKQ